MKLCRYWAVAEATATGKPGQALRLRKWGGSNTSMEEARKTASVALEAMRRKVEGIGFNLQDDYSYSMREVPEELMREITADSGITRNGKGCLVLNAANAFFADIDIRDPSFIARLFGATREKAEQDCIKKLKDFLVRHPEIGTRIYRTKAGLRYLFTHAPVPVDAAAIGWLNELGSDKMYVRLCKNQKCYRARLTPKPFRIGCPRIEGHYPFEKDGEKARFESWLGMYERNSAPYAVCKLVGTEGSTGIHRDLAAIVKEHDTATRCNDDLPLA